MKPCGESGDAPLDTLDAVIFLQPAINVPENPYLIRRDSIVIS